MHSNVRAFYGNNPANYKYELGQREYKFRTLWTEGINDTLRVVTYPGTITGIMSDNERYGIQIANYDVYVLINGRKYH